MPAETKESLYEFVCKHPECSNLLEEYCSDNIRTVYSIPAKDSRENVHWYCSKHNYEWYGYVSPRLKYPKAPCCANHVATSENNFAVLYPEYVKDWDYELNSKSPEQYLPFSHERVYWKCHKCGNKWSTKLYSRSTRLTSCPNCSLVHTSKAEMLITAYIRRTFPKASKVKIENMEFDIFIPEINVAIEYDGYPWHLKKKNTHIKKLEIANRNNIVLLNIAECKNRQEVIEEVRNQYTDQHRVYYYIIDSVYTLNGLVELIHDIFKSNGIELGGFTEMDKTDIITKTASKEMGNSLWNSSEIPWIRNWISPKDIDKAKTITPSSTTNITIRCPNCGREWETKAHWLKKQFRGCTKRAGGCGCTEGLEEQLIISSEGFRNSYLNRADKLKEKRVNKNA